MYIFSLVVHSGSRGAPGCCSNVHSVGSRPCPPARGQCSVTSYGEPHARLCAALRRNPWDPAWKADYKGPRGPARTSRRMPVETMRALGPKPVRAALLQQIGLDLVKVLHGFQDGGFGQTFHSAHVHEVLAPVVPAEASEELEGGAELRARARLAVDEVVHVEGSHPKAELLQPTEAESVLAVGHLDKLIQRRADLCALGEGLRRECDVLLAGDGGQRERRARTGAGALP